MKRVADWPVCLQFVVFGPHAILAGILMWVWWPTSDKGLRRFAILAAYLVAFYLVMHYYFGF